MHSCNTGTYCTCLVSLSFELLQQRALPPLVSGHGVGLATPLGSLLIAQYSGCYRTTLVYCGLQVLGTKAFLSLSTALVVVSTPFPVDDIYKDGRSQAKVKGLDELSSSGSVLGP